ncbi:putative aminoacrylate hydrolase RutD [Smittium culicis]|uniref:Putative aminoacrylate hydrolase RutD n=1 Tax=Smittium culicis TaxID=133412 RepID=A0A1R1YI51_9FUNG|nr:putative aminoacrylate hydrolase RutD [Smittium culicis]
MSRANTLSFLFPKFLNQNTNTPEDTPNIQTQIPKTFNELSRKKRSRLLCLVESWIKTKDVHSKGYCDVSRNSSGNRNIKIYYEVYGNGPKKLFLVMGMLGSTDFWKIQTQTLSKNPEYQICVFDNRGSGRSSIGKGPYNTTEMAVDSLLLLKHLDWTQNVHLLGVSLGGMIVQKMCLLATYFFSTKTGKFFPIEHALLQFLNKDHLHDFQNTSTPNSPTNSPSLSSSNQNQNQNQNLNLNSNKNKGAPCFQNYTLFKTVTLVNTYQSSIGILPTKKGFFFALNGLSFFNGNIEPLIDVVFTKSWLNEKFDLKKYFSGYDDNDDKHFDYLNRHVIFAVFKAIKKNIAADKSSHSTKISDLLKTDTPFDRKKSLSSTANSKKYPKTRRRSSNLNNFPKNLKSKSVKRSYSYNNTLNTRINSSYLKCTSSPNLIHPQKLEIYPEPHTQNNDLSKYKISSNDNPPEKIHRLINDDYEFNKTAINNPNNVTSDYKCEKSIDSSTLSTKLNIYPSVNEASDENETMTNTSNVSTILAKSNDSSFVDSFISNLNSLTLPKTIKDQPVENFEPPNPLIFKHITARPIKTNRYTLTRRVSSTLTKKSSFKLQKDSNLTAESLTKLNLPTDKKSNGYNRLSRMSIFKGLKQHVGDVYQLTAAVGHNLSYDETKLIVVRNPNTKFMVIHGSKDNVIRSSYCRNLAQHLDALYATIYDAGHMPMFDAPETFNNLFEGFVNNSDWFQISTDDKSSLVKMVGIENHETMALAIESEAHSGINNPSLLKIGPFINQSIQNKIKENCGHKTNVSEGSIAYSTSKAKSPELYPLNLYNSQNSKSNNVNNRKTLQDPLHPNDTLSNKDKLCKKLNPKRSWSTPNLANENKNSTKSSHEHSKPSSINSNNKIESHISENNIEAEHYETDKIIEAESYDTDIINKAEPYETDNINEVESLDTENISKTEPPNNNTNKETKSHQAKSIDESFFFNKSKGFFSFFSFKYNKKKNLFDSSIISFEPKTPNTIERSKNIIVQSNDHVYPVELFQTDKINASPISNAGSNKLFYEVSAAPKSYKNRHTSSIPSVSSSVTALDRMHKSILGLFPKLFKSKTYPISHLPYFGKKKNSSPNAEIDLSALKRKSSSEGLQTNPSKLAIVEQKPDMQDENLIDQVFTEKNIEPKLITDDDAHSFANFSYRLYKLQPIEVFQNDFFGTNSKVSTVKNVISELEPSLLGLEFDRPFKIQKYTNFEKSKLSSATSTWLDYTFR